LNNLADSKICRQSLARYVNKVRKCQGKKIIRLTSRIRWLRKKRRGNDGLLKSYWVSPSGENNMRGLVKLLGSPTSQKVLYLSPHCV
jgi:hypothetical protein